LKPNTPFDSLKVSASSGLVSTVDRVIAARRIGAPVSSFSTTPLMAANGDGGACARAKPGAASQTATAHRQPIRIYPLLDHCGTPAVPKYSVIHLIAFRDACGVVRGSGRRRGILL
jgi:hypothetical protein